MSRATGMFFLFCFLFYYINTFFKVYLTAMGATAARNAQQQQQLQQLQHGVVKILFCYY